MLSMHNTKIIIRRKSQARIWTYGIVAVLSLAALFYIAPPVSTDNSHALVGTSIASDTTLSISLSGSVLPLDITPTSSSGTFASTANDSEEANTAVIHVATNNITGYTLGIKASNPNSSSAGKLISNNEQCENTPTSAKCAVSSLPQAVSETQYIDNTVEGVDLNNTWGYAPSTYNSISNTTTTTTLDPSTNENITITSPINYYPAPVSGDTIATTSGPNPESTNNTNNDSNSNELVEDEYTIDYGMRIDYSTYAGTYSTNYNNQSYIITAVGNPVPYSVSYNANKPEQAPSTSTVDNVPSAQTGTVSSGSTVSVVLSDKVPTIGTTDPSTGDYTYAGYVFNGWCSVEPEVPTEIDGQPNTNGYQVCPVDQPQPGQEDPVLLLHPGDSIGIDQTADNTTTLYAVWGAPATVTFSSNGLIFDDTTTTTTTTTNTINYIPTYEGNIITGQRRNRVYTGAYQTPIYEETTPTPTNFIFKGWSTDQQSTGPTYTDEQAIIEDLDISADDNITLYASWAYTTVITFDKNGADGTEIMIPQTIEANTTASLEQNTYTNTGLVLGSWNTAADGTGDSYANRGDFTTAAGSSNVTLFAQWTEPCAPNKICYDDNGANSLTTMDPQSTSSSTDVELWASNYKYDVDGDGHNDYGFAGWSEDKDATTKLTDNNPDNNPVVYGPNQTITTGDLSTEGMKLYAVWIAPEQNTSLQDFSCPTNEDMSIGTVIALKDNRDNEVYTVAKLADGNCWMTENLRLDNNATINATNTNSPISTFTALSPSSNSWCRDNTDACYNQSMLNTNNTANPVSPMTGTGANIYSYSNYYNWYSATAGNGTYSKRSDTVAGDLCPAGWHLPYGGSGTGEKGGNTSGGFYYLNQRMGGDTSTQGSKNWRSFPNNFVYSSHWGSSSASGRGSGGSYWSSTAYSTDYAYSLGFGSGYVTPGTNGYKRNGLSVRCVAPVE